MASAANSTVELVDVTQHPNGYWVATFAGPDGDTAQAADKFGSWMLPVDPAAGHEDPKAPRKDLLAPWAGQAADAVARAQASDGDAPAPARKPRRRAS